MRYYPSKKKPLNYFERQKQRLHPKKYRYYFLPDYFYYCGERWGERGARTSGLLVLMLYWMFCVMLPLGFEPVSMLPLSLSDNERSVAAMALSFVPPIALCLLRYRKERRSALMNHYRRSEWVKGIPVWFVCLGWFPLAMLEVWLIIELGWNGLSDLWK